MAFLKVTLPADELDDAERIGQYAIKIARHLVQVIPNANDRPAWDSLKELLSSDGPMGGTSRQAWLRILEWLPAARSAGDMLNMPSVSI
ncbi:hypothetical protein [Nonomuraea sp. NPDC023979]|uniref:hypothetical protein n=1 Tax=Nonomuraea sp. NPDC023979 TaxID=3154796 RepID=UPI0033C5DCF9